MARTKISKAAKDFNVSIQTVVDFLQKKGITIDNNPNSRIDEEAYDLLIKEYQPDRDLKTKSDNMSTDRKVKEVVETPAAPAPVAAPEEMPRPVVGPKVLGKIDLETGQPIKPEAPKEAAKAQPKEEKPAAPAAVPEPAPKPAPAPQAEAPVEKPKAEQPAASVSAPKAAAPKKEKPAAPAPVEEPKH